MEDDIGLRHLFPYLPGQIAGAPRNVRIGKKQQPHRVILQQIWPLASVTARFGSGFADVEGVVGAPATAREI
jgi:hypothetical protein